MTDPRPADEDRLAAGLRAGDADALAELYDRFARRVYALAAAIVGDPRDAEEVVSDTFVQVWGSVDRFDPGRGSLESWVVTIGRSRALDRARATGRRQRIETDAGGVAAFELSNRPADPSARALARVDAGRSLTAPLADLPPEQRRAIELAYFGGLTQAEIAEALGAPLGTIKTRIRTGMRRLKDAVAARAGEGAG